MIVSRTPFRISLFGGGTDMPDWIRDHGGAVLGLAINKYCYISVRALPPFFEHKHRIVYSDIECVREGQEIVHPSVRAVFAEMDIDGGIELHHDADLPARSGLGSSSAFTVGLIHSLSALHGRRINKSELASEAIRIEQNVIGEAVGCQDQVWAAHGGLNRIDFGTEGFTVSPITVRPSRRIELAQSLLLVFSGISRIASEIEGAKIANIGRNERQLLRLREMVDEGEAILRDEREPLARLGALLHDSWLLKRSLDSRVSNDMIDSVYQSALSAGAGGGKVMGAGGGGFLVLFVEPGRRAAVADALRGLVQVSVDINNEGSRIMIYEPNGIGA